MDHPEKIVTQLIQEEHRSKWIASSNHNVKCFTEDEIKGFTNNYKTILGKGAFGEVYEGALEDKTKVAVKRFIYNGKQSFAKELTVHREINHKNVVRLVGYCVDENSLVVVTEYMHKGNLSDILHHDSISIAWDTRLRIAIECAEALGYMHSQMYTQVIHGDIKPANILLDDELGAKISDFGISRLVDSGNTLYTENVVGSRGYMDPLFVCTGRFTPKSDVYSFGVVLLELVTRKKARNDGEVYLTESFTNALAKGMWRVRQMFDFEIAIPGNMETIEKVAQLAGKCLSLELDRRPEMVDVAECLRRLRKALHESQGRRAWFSWGKKKKQAPADTPSQDSSSPSHNVRSSSILNFRSIELEDLLRCSAEVLGKGTIGTTYKAVLESGATLVVKRLKDLHLEIQKEKFEQGAMMIGAIQNEHIVPLERFFYSKDEKLVVYNYFHMGSLANMLHGGGVSGTTALDWEQRVAISLAAARGVASIHSAGPSSCHGNIKSSNVLLTGTHDACLSEHGLVTLGMAFRGASGYTAPEITDNKWVSQEADVYSFGVLLLELLTGFPPRDISPVVREAWMADMELLRRKQQKDGQEECISQLLQLALNCCSQDANLRPTMSDVVQRIEEIR